MVLRKSPLAIPLLAAALSLAAAGTGGPEAVWLPDASRAGIPSTPAHGRLDGKPFHVDMAVVKPYWEESGNVGDPPSKKDRVEGVDLRLQEGTSILPPRSVTIFAMAKPGERVDGKTYVLTPGGLFNQPTKILDRNGKGWFSPIAGIQLHADRPGAKPRDDLFPRCTMRLTFGIRHGSELPGRIYLTVNDPQRSFVAGTFAATIRDQ
jgi:hypothetical protein